MSRNRLCLALGSAAALALSVVTAQAQDRADSNARGDRNSWRIRIDRSRSGPLALSQEEQAGEEALPTTSQVTETEPEAEPTAGEPIVWKGFLYGDQYFRDTPRPVGAPLYFEDPFINTDVRPFFMWHKFPRASALKGGQLFVYAAQARLALTERLQFFATGDGSAHIESPILNDDTGANDLALGLKYAVIVDHDNDFLLSTGLRWRLSNGRAGILNGNVDELSPFLTMYKGIGKWNVIADVVGRLAMNEDQGNHILSWDLHVDYELLEDFFPLVEFHGLHYLHNGDRLPLDVGGLDYANIGSNDVAGTAAFWGGIGFRWNIVDHVSWGAVYEFPLQDPQNNDIFDQRVTTNLVITF